MHMALHCVLPNLSIKIVLCNVLTVEVNVLCDEYEIFTLNSWEYNFLCPFQDIFEHRSTDVETAHKPITCLMALLLFVGKSSNVSFLQTVLPSTLKVAIETLMMVTKNCYVIKVNKSQSIWHPLYKMS